ncbi:MAG: hypothetical protein ACI3X1_00995 [Eubacteriales bacterium]
MNSGNFLSDVLETSAEKEESDLPHKEFVMRTGKLLKILLTIAVIASFGIGLPMFFLLDRGIALLLLIPGGCGALVLPSLLSYRCKVDKISIKEEYWVLFIKVEKEVLWDDIKFKKVTIGNNKSIKLYDENKKKLLSFDGATVGFNRIVKMANRSTIQKLK